MNQSELFAEVLIFATVLAPIITALVQLIKNAANIPVNILPLIAVAVGLFIGLAAQPFTDLSLTLRLWAGGLAGLSGTGLYELVVKREGQTKGEGK